MDSHMLSARFAKHARVGLCLAKKLDNSSFIADPIIKMFLSRKKGVFSPVTKQGTIVVNTIQVSCYSSVENQALQRAVHSALIATDEFLQSMMNFFGLDTDTAYIAKEESKIPKILNLLLKLVKFILPESLF
jgi:hypothetical protein